MAYTYKWPAHSIERYPRERPASTDRTAPTWDNQLWHARRLYWDAVDRQRRALGYTMLTMAVNPSARAKELRAGYEAVNNPHAMTGRQCGCGECFCCAALHVAREHMSAGGVQSAPD